MRVWKMKLSNVVEFGTQRAREPQVEEAVRRHRAADIDQQHQAGGRTKRRSFHADEGVPPLATLRRMVAGRSRRRPCMRASRSRRRRSGFMRRANWRISASICTTCSRAVSDSEVSGGQRVLVGRRRCAAGESRCRPAWPRPARPGALWSDGLTGRRSRCGEVAAAATGWEPRTTHRTVRRNGRYSSPRPAQQCLQAPAQQPGGSSTPTRCAVRSTSTRRHRRHTNPFARRKPGKAMSRAAARVGKGNRLGIDISMPLPGAQRPRAETRRGRRAS